MNFAIGRRNESVFPDTANGDVLFGLAQNGDRLWVPKAIDCSFIFASLQSAGAFAKSLANTGLKVEVSKYEGAPGYSHEVQIIKHMLPTHALISEFEPAMQTRASANGGRADGWGYLEAVD